MDEYSVTLDLLKIGYNHCEKISTGTCDYMQSIIMKWLSENNIQYEYKLDLWYIIIKFNNASDMAYFKLVWS